MATITVGQRSRLLFFLWLLLATFHMNRNDATTSTGLHHHHRELRSSDSSSSSSSSLSLTDTSLYVESKTTYYDGYQQAWRMLGFFVECTSSYSNNNNNNNNHDNKNKNNNGGSCTRSLLWAAFIDPGYSGGGLYEYSFYDPETNTYDNSSSCALRSDNNNNNNNHNDNNNNKNQQNNHRCALMDCHETDTTTWKLLGLYKEQYYGSEWFEQLFKHEGYCIWSQDEYKFMKGYYESWPEGCTQTDYKTKDGSASLYFDLKPGYGGYMMYHFYTDSICKTELAMHPNDNNDPYASLLEQALAKKNYLYGSNLQTFNKYLNIYKYCQPCTAYSLYNANNNNNNNGHRMLNDNNYFYCYDAAGYENVNQCMKFKTKTTMEYATMQNLQDAHQQGGIVGININGRIYGSPYLESISLDGTYQGDPEAIALQQRNAASYALASSPAANRRATALLVSSILILVGGISFLVGTIRWKIKRNMDRLKRKGMMEEPLVDDDTSYGKSLKHEDGILA